MSHAPVGHCLGLSMVTPSTGYRRENPRSWTSSCPRLFLAAITCAMPQLTRVHARYAYSKSAALISSRSVDCIDPSSWTRNQRFGGENIQRGRGRRRVKKGVEIHQDLRRQRCGAGSVVDSQPGIVAHDERIGCQGFGTVGTPLRETRNSRAPAVFVVQDEH